MTPFPASRTAALYLRVSTAAQAGDERFGLAGQTRDATQYASAAGLRIVETYQDVITGTKATRYDTVLISAVDRLARYQRLPDARAARPDAALLTLPGEAQLLGVVGW